MREKNKTRLFYWIPVMGYCLLIFVQSSYPSAPRPEDLPHTDKLLHFLAYAILGVLFFRAFGNTLQGKADSRLLMILSIIGASLYGISDEIHQHYVPSRHADMADILADTIGGIYGVFFYHLFLPKLETLWQRVRKLRLP